MSLQRNTEDLLPKLQAMALADRAVFEKGMKAFVSFVQAYAKHECSLIFRLKGKPSLTFAHVGFVLRQALSVALASSCYIDQAGLNLGELFTSASQVLVLKLCATVPGIVIFFESSGVRVALAY